MSDKETIARSTDTSADDWSLLSKNILGSGGDIGLIKSDKGIRVQGGTKFSVYEHRKMGMTAFLDRRPGGKQFLLVVEDRTFEEITNEEVTESH